MSSVVEKLLDPNVYVNPARKGEMSPEKPLSHSCCEIVQFVFLASLPLTFDNCIFKIELSPPQGADLLPPVFPPPLLHRFLLLKQ